ncbi:MAG: tRNA (adenosine(37)-N6)-dimethylallyltransferase MiaA [Oscillatoriales cyanobacterium SM2_2_1]|nr:tRNA (adenosine(37)-N6)-dimethylallyltransferase MiaA [Oscillatoriales cyanobacterium SM2_2_1]
MKYPPGLIVIVGATATGKTSLAIQLAQTLSLPILNGDSRQVYRYFDIGTAKPTLTQQQGVPHHLLDIAEPDAPLTVAMYQQQAQGLIQTFHQQGVTPILVGGSGLYIRAIIAGLTMPAIAPQPDLRHQLSQLGQEQCHALLQHLDPPSAAKIHGHDSVRTLRALEVFYCTGQPLSQLCAACPPPYPIWQFGLPTPPAPLYRQSLGDRTRAMLAAGWLAEVQSLRHRYGAQLPLLRTLGYAELGEHLDGHIPLSEATVQIEQHTYQFAKRQRTWFAGKGKEPHPIHWLYGSPTENLSDILHSLRGSST